MIFVDRLSNVMSWIGFLCSITCFSAALILISGAALDNFIERKTATDLGYPSEKVTFLNRQDILRSKRLQELGAQPGDAVIENKLISTRPEWVSKYSEMSESIINTFYIILISIGAALINYLLVGSPRILPWKPY